MRQSGFSLAEVLITIGILGVVAVLTIPVFQNNSRDVETVAKLRKMQSTLQNAVNLTMADYGSVGDLAGTGLFSGPDDAYAIFGISQADLVSGVKVRGIAQFLNIYKNCGLAVGCFPQGVTYKYLNNADWSELYGRGDRPKLILQDGTLVWAVIQNCSYDAGDGVLDGSVCARIGFDLNGNKPPNQAGRDLFYFWITNKGVVYPTGIDDDKIEYTMNSACTTSSYGEGCANRVLKENGIKY